MKHKKEVSAGGIIYKTSGDSVEWLITQHSQHKGWGFPKGLVGDSDHGESPEVAALREVREEGGIVARIVDFEYVENHYTYKFHDTMIDKTVYYYLMEYVSGDPADHDWEVSEARFVGEDEVRATLTFEADKQSFEKILKKKSGAA